MQTAQNLELEHVPSCLLCGSTSHTTVFSGLTDRWFEAPGTWAFQACTGCGLVYLAPRPTAATVGNAYAHYYTHGAAEGAPAGEKEKRGLARLFAPLRRKRDRLEEMYLSDRPPGNLLDIGCGDGIRLLHMRERGWQVTGVETDPAAVHVATVQHGLSVFNGEVTDAGFPADQFDAITLSHVIEHVYRPVELLAECRRILKPGGLLVIVTPNVASLGRRWFRSHWREWDPPRHCYLYAPGTLHTLAERGGFARPEIGTTGLRANVVAAGSLQIRTTGRYRPEMPISGFDRLRSNLFLLCEGVWSIAAPGQGEELVMRVMK